jgi:hypothetical protein
MEDGMTQLAGKVAIITGASSGIGNEAASTSLSTMPERWVRPAN